MSNAALSEQRIAPGVLQITLDRPFAANALNSQMGRELHDRFFNIALDAGDCRCVVLTGAGRHFCAGGDNRERDGMSDQAWRRQHVVFEHAFRAVMECPIPVIAAVNGAAYGGGAELALCCDFIYVAQSARFAFVETGLGIIPGGGGTQNLARAVGVRRARELLYTGQVITSHDALSWGMVNQVTDDDSLLSSALQTASVIASRAPIAVRQAKLAATRGVEADLATGLALEIEAYNRTVSTADRREGVAAAREKRTPIFTGE